jgi:hypothetical protein
MQRGSGIFLFLFGERLCSEHDISTARAASTRRVRIALLDWGLPVPRRRQHVGKQDGACEAAIASLPHCYALLG